MSFSPHPWDFQLPNVSSSLHKRHPNAALRQARWIKDEFDINSILEWRQKVSWITIDSIISPDLDDGIHIERIENTWWYRLYVSIASPTEIIPVWSAIDKEAFDRATSVYFWENHIQHMVPNLVSTDVASLNHKQQRPTLTLELEINTNFEVVKRDLYKSVFLNNHRHDPESFTHGFTHTSSLDYEYFNTMHELARWLFSRRDNPHRITRFDDSDRRIVQGEKIYGHSNDHVSSFIIQEFMILANSEVAGLMQSEWVNGVYRKHMSEYSDGRELPRVLDRAQYSSDIWFHTGLWIPEYMHFTSPIRRLADYVSHRQLICLLSWESELYSAEQIHEICRYINLQIIAITWHQKNELLDHHGKRLLRKSKRKDGDLKGVISHVKHRQDNGLKIPEPIKKVIIEDIQDTSKPLENWIISRFLWNGERDILEALVERIKSESRIVKYLNIFKSAYDVQFKEHESFDEEKGIFHYGITIEVNGKEVETIIESWEKIKGWEKAVARTRGVLKLWKSFESMRRHDMHSLQSRVKSKVRKKARDLFLDYLLKK